MRSRRTELCALIFFSFLCLVTSPGTDESPSFQNTNLPSASPAPGPVPPLQPSAENDHGFPSSAQAINRFVESKSPNDMGTWRMNLPERVESPREGTEGGMQGSRGVMVSETGSVVVTKDGIDEEVFVPLKEWKQKKLEDIELRVRRIEEKGGVVSRAYTVKSGKKKKTRRFGVETNGVCWIATPKGMGVLTIRRDSWIYRHQGEGGVVFAPEEEKNGFKGGAEVDDMELRAFSDTGALSGVKDRLAAASLETEDRRAKIVHESDEIMSDMSSTTAFTPLYGPMEKLKLEAMEKCNRIAEGPNQSLVAVRQKGVGSPIDALMAIRIVGDIVRSIKEVSYALASSPANSIQTQRSPVEQNDLRMGNKSDKKSIAEKKWNVSRRHGKKKKLDSEIEAPDSTDRKLESTVSAEGAKGRPFNFASADAGARILASSAGVVGAKNVIEGSMDKYSLAPCNGEGLGGSRWIDVELSEDIILESVKTGNLEYYSSSAKKIAILGASTYPPVQWNVLGVFDFAHIRALQRFEIKDRLTTTRYLRIMFAGKQGHEFYCPISTIQAFGKNLIADWKDAFESSVEGARKVDARPKAKENDGMKIQDTESVNKDDVHHAYGRLYGVSDRRMIHGEVCTQGKHCEANEKQVDSRGGGEGIKEMISAQRQDGLSEELESNSKSETSEMRNKESANANGDPDSDEAIGILSGGANTNENSADKSGSYGELESKNEGREETETMSEEDKAVFEAVRADALSSVSGNDNIFRKVTRLIRLLELNQTLTNQYIDTHLSRFAKALTKAQMETSRAQEVAAVTEHRIVGVMLAMEGRVQELKGAMLKRDVVLCVLVVCVAFLVGTNWVLWTAVSGVRLRGRGDEVEMMMSTGSGVTEVCRTGKPPAGKRRRNDKGEKERGEFVVSGRSVSSMELGMVAKEMSRKRMEKGGLDGRRGSLEGMSKGM